ncbi:hypothetical protein ACO0LF_01245 [Undibacterium sp. Di27W]|uniref:hypothetical protein n=1 Tax=Undibacterium sp. Di27W TaxID=3413036 RepID=UPI003BF34197
MNTPISMQTSAQINLSKRYSWQYKAIKCVLSLMAGLVLVSCGGGGSSGGSTVVSGGDVIPPKETQVNGPAWFGLGRNAQHDAISGIATQALNRILWKTGVDLAPQYSAAGYLFYHYGSPVITAKNTVILPVKSEAADTYRFEARSGSTGAQIWSVPSDYIMPTHRWTPSYNLTLTSNNRVYAPGAGGKLYYRDDADSATATTQTAVFYGDAKYTAAKAALDAAVFINTPVTADAQNNIYFGFVANAGNAAGVRSGFARITADGKATWVAVAGMTEDASIVKPATNSAPAVSADQKTVYVVVNAEAATGIRQAGYLLALDSATLAVKSKVRLMDPQEKAAAFVSDDSTASPTIGPDGDVYIGVLETTAGAHNQRGWMLHFNADLSQTKLPGSFGWDDTASIVPSSMMPSYKGSSPYLIMVKYNNYARSGTGDSKNRIAILDPNTSQKDSVSAQQVMTEVLTILGATPDPNWPGGVYEWCINTAAVDPFTRSIVVNSEDGYLYRWDLATNTLSERIRLTSGLGESYTPTAIGADGAVYAINNAVLFAVGK